MKKGIRGQALLGIVLCLTILALFSFEVSGYESRQPSAVSISAVSNGYMLPPVRISDSQRDSKGARGFICPHKLSPELAADAASSQGYFIPILRPFLNSVIDSIFKGDIQQAYRLLDIPPPPAILS